MTKLVNAGLPLLDPCVGTFTTARSCMMIRNQCQFTGSEIYPMFFNASDPAVLGTFIGLVSSICSDFTGNPVVIKDPRTYLGVRNGTRLRTWKMFGMPGAGISRAKRL